MKAGGDIRIICDGGPVGLPRLVTPRLEAAARALELSRFVTGVHLCLDDLPGGDGAWYQREEGPEGVVLRLYCHPDDLARRHPGGQTSLLTREVWEQAPAPRDEDLFDPGSTDLSRADAFLHHHLLTVTDIFEGRVDHRDLSLAVAEAFTAVWAVGVDGRLERAGWPGYGLQERRGRFSRLFSAAGILLPDHWQIFQAVWDGALATQKDILTVVRQLPRL